MALLITSSTQARYGDSDFQIENAYSYKNFLSNPTIIPKNSAVCVQSIKFNRQGHFVVKGGDYISYVLNSKTHSSVNKLIDNNTMTPIAWGIKPGTYNSKQFEKAIKTGLDSAIQCHPDMEKVVVEKVITSGKFAGYKITTNQKVAPTDQTELIKAFPIIDIYNNSGDQGTGQIPYSLIGGSPTYPMWTGGLMNADSTVPFTANTSTYEYTAGTKTGTFKGGFGLQGYTLMYSPTCPVSLQGGGYQVGVDKYVGTEAGRTVTSYQWISSLCRPMAVGYDAIANAAGDGDWYDYHNVGVTIPPWTSLGGGGGALFNPNVRPPSGPGNWTQFGDYWCACRLNVETAIYELQVGYYGLRPGVSSFNNLPPQGTNDKYTSKLRYMNQTKDHSVTNCPTELQYWNATGTRVETTPVAPGSVAGPYDMGANANGYKAFRWELKGENVFLYAVKADNSEDFVVSITEDPTINFPAISQNQVRLYPKLMVQNDDVLAGNTSLTISAYKGRDMGETEGAGTSIEHFGNGFYENNIGDQVAEEIDRRGVSSDPAFAYTRVGYDNATDIIGYVPQYVLGITPDIQPQFLITQPEANTRELLGFDKSFIAGTLDASAGSRGGYILTSANVPNAQGQEHSLFVRCPTLTQMSQNFGRGGMSKIIHHIPQFDNTGKSIGSLFFENTSPMYLRLGNTEDIMLNELQIDIVDRNEQYAYELDGSTIVVLHIKPENQI